MTELKLYNTLTREKTVFQPIDPNNVRMYVCGPTVYDFAHIGNARPVIVFDVLYRLLRHVYGADHVTYVRNITDVDDKINARALRDHPDLPLNEAIRLVTEKTETQFLEDAKALGTLEPTVQPRATDNITQMVAIIQSLLDKGHAYVAEGSEGREVLFEVRSMADYGQLSKRNLDDQQAGARIAVEAHKRNPADFVLWKQSADTEPGWHAEFTVDGATTDIYGRPGWHIECSAMSGRYLGDTFDIHGGGLDLIFPHHENEIAQSRCAHGSAVMANVWMHNGFLQVEGRKMSKSEGNFVTIHELLATEKFGGRTWPGDVLRLAMLMTHYRDPIDFTQSKLIEAENTLAKWRRAADGARAFAPGSIDRQILNYLANDLNTTLAVKRLSALASDAYGIFYERGTVSDDEVSTAKVNAARSLVVSATLLGFDLLKKEDISAEEKHLIENRLELIRAKKFAEADKIRGDLLSKGIQLKDGKDPETGERVTTWEVKR
jgi:cysteinyl-tRNA synthetase